MSGGKDIRIGEKGELPLGRYKLGLSFDHSAHMRMPNLVDFGGKIPPTSCHGGVADHEVGPDATEVDDAAPGAADQSGA